MFPTFFRTLPSWSAIALVCALLASCFETKQEFTLNPDGSGKMVLDTTFPNISMNGQQELSEKVLQGAVADFIKRVEGIEAWRDVSYEWTGDGRVHFKGTGYFADIANLDLDNISMMDFEWKTDGDKGTLAMKMKEDDDGGGAEKEIAKDPEERAKQIEQERAQFQQTKPMMAGMLNGMKHTAAFNLPGKAGETINFTSVPDDKVSIQITGEKMISAMESLVNDDEWMKENSFDSQEGPSGNEEMSQALFGNEKPPVANRVSVGEPLFDYAKELKTAQAEFKKLQEELGPKIAPAAQGEPFESLEVVGVRFVSEVDEGSGLRPFNSEPGYSLSLFGKFSGSVLSMTDGSKLEKAVADDGSDLLPARDFKRGIRFPRLSEDRSAVVFEIDLRSPGKEVKSIREISGTVQYTVSEGTKEVDLGFASLKSGESGKELNAKIIEIKDGWNKDGTKNIEIELAVGKGEIKDLVMLEGAKRTVLASRGYSSFGSGTNTFTFEAEGGVPENAKLIAVLYDGIQTYDVPFKLENISLLGISLGEQ